MVTLDVIIAIRSHDEVDLVERLRGRHRYEMPDGVQYIVVDDGSPVTDAYDIERACKEINARYIRLDTADKCFNLSRARNAGIRASEADYLLFEDVDLFFTDDFYVTVQEEVETLLVSGDWEFMAFPVIYLSESGTEFVKADIQKNVRKAISEVALGTSDMIDSYAPVSSMLICSREMCRSVGGFDEAFEGWGFEDSDFWLRVLRNSPIEKSRDFYRLDTRNYSDQVQWRGWRAYLRMFGDLMAMKGLYGFHEWHPPAAHKSDRQRARNRSIFMENSKLYANATYVPHPMVDMDKPTQLFVSLNPHAWGIQQFSMFRNAFHIDEYSLSVNSIASAIAKYNVECVVMPNPYGHEHRRRLYDELRAMGTRCIVVERGALPGSVYFDDGGFCAESESYRPEHWNFELSEEQRDAALAYTQELIQSGATLEPQPGLVGGTSLRKKWTNRDQSKKLLFVALQSPSDTTTNHFCGAVRSYGAFLHEMQELASMLPPDWKMVYKNHPLAKSKVSIPGATCVDDAHIGDVLEAVDACCMLNSGVGVLSICYGKPVFHFGQAFYECDGLTYAAETCHDVLDQLDSGLSFDSEMALRFVHYLTQEFYSFAKWTRKERDHTAVAKMSISVDIRFEVLRCAGYETIEFKEHRMHDVRQSVLFDRYRLDDYVVRKSTPAPAKPKAKPKPVAAPAAKPAPKEVAKPPVPASKPATTPTVLGPMPANNVEVTENKSVGRDNVAGRKLRKLINSPGLFVTDALRNRLH